MWKFKPTADTTEMDNYPDIKQAWHDLINFYFEHNIVGKPQDQSLSALEELQKWGRSFQDLRYYNPALNDRTANATPSSVFWKALPTSFDEMFGDDTDRLYKFLDERQVFPGLNQKTRIQDEYCEWSIKRNSEGKITKILFTSEPPEFYRFLYEDWFNVGKDKTHALLLELYSSRCDYQEIAISDLGNGRDYNSFNKWNNEYCVHMQQPNNTLGAQVNIAARSSILRLNTSNRKPITDDQKLIMCARYGDPSRQSDPRIGSAINTQARKNNFITLENPVGLYMSSFDPTGIISPDGTPASEFWHVIKGKDDVDPKKAMIVRAEFSVPNDKGYTVSDLEIGREAINFGAQIAAKINIRVGVLVSEGGEVPYPRAIGCTKELPIDLGDIAKINIEARNMS